jgi:hypothetical protein
LIFEDDQKLVDAKRKTKRKLKIFTKSNKRLNLDHLFPDNGARKRGLVDGIYVYQTSFGLQVDKSFVVVKGPFFPQV